MGRSCQGDVAGETSRRLASGTSSRGETDKWQLLCIFRTAYTANPLTSEALKLYPQLFTTVCLAAGLISSAEERPAAAAASAAKQLITGDLQLLQGIWEGVQVGEESRRKISITITGSSLHFHRDTNFWFETTITLPALTHPRQLHATIKNSSPPTNSIGQVVRAIFKIEDGKLTLATGGDGEEGTPKSFEPTEDKGVALYELRKTQAQKQNAQPPGTN